VAQRRIVQGLSLHPGKESDNSMSSSPAQLERYLRRATIGARVSQIRRDEGFGVKARDGMRVRGVAFGAGSGHAKEYAYCSVVALRRHQHGCQKEPALSEPILAVMGPSPSWALTSLCGARSIRHPRILTRGLAPFEESAGLFPRVRWATGRVIYLSPPVKTEAFLVPGSSEEPTPHPWLAQPLPRQAARLTGMSRVSYLVTAERVSGMTAPSSGYAAV